MCSMGSFFGRLTLLALFCLVQWVSAGYASEDAKAHHVKPVRFDLKLTWEDREVAGFVRKAIVSNGQFPAPTLWLRQGDEVEFVVDNQMPFSTTIHFHGIEQVGTPWSDGVPGLSQRPIESGDKFIYRWKAEGQYGAYLYHAHRRSQIDDGLYGAIYIMPDDSVERPFHGITKDPIELAALYKAERDTRSVLMSDWRRLTSEQVWQAEVETGLDAYCTNAMLINGKGSVQCLPRSVLEEATTPGQQMLLQSERFLTDIGCMPPIEAIEGPFEHNVEASSQSFYSGCKPSQGPIEVLKVNPAAGWVSYDLSTAGGVSTPTFSIDEHSMWLYAIDGRYIEPMKIDAITISNGMRFSVFVKLDQPYGEYTIRAPNTGLNQIIYATAILSYEDTLHIGPTQIRPSQPSIDITGTNTTTDVILFDETKVTPFPSIEPSTHVDRTYILKIDHYNASYVWTMGDKPFDMRFEDVTPLLFNRSAIPADLTITTRNGTWVDLIMNVASPVQPPHPIHKHSNKYFVIGQGTGAWNYSSVAEAMKEIPENFNLKTPQIRDTYNTPAAAEGPAWLALRYQVVNPGPFLLHCHLQVHLSGGMAMALLDGVDKWPDVPEGYELPVLE